MSSAEMHPWTRAHWTHCRLSHCCWHQCHPPGWGPGKASAVGALGMGPLQDKRIPRAWGPLPHQPLLGDRSCLGHEEDRKTGKAKRPPRMYEGAWRSGGRFKVGDLGL